jgi:hypothetical protein
MSLNVKDLRKTRKKRTHAPNTRRRGVDRPNLFPLGIVLNKVQHLEWEQIKDRLKEQRDTDAFLKLMIEQRTNNVDGSAVHG